MSQTKKCRGHMSALHFNACPICNPPKPAEAPLASKPMNTSTDLVIPETNHCQEFRASVCGDKSDLVYMAQGVRDICIDASTVVALRDWLNRAFPAETDARRLARSTQLGAGWCAHGVRIGQPCHQCEAEAANVVLDRNRDERFVGHELARETSDDWRPIDTAPKGGKWVLLWWPWVTDAAFSGYEVDGNWYAAPTGDTWTSDLTKRNTVLPTHWKPLPKGPSEKTSPPRSEES